MIERIYTAGNVLAIALATFIIAGLTLNTVVSAAQTLMPPAVQAVTAPAGCTDMSFNPCADLDTSRIDYDPRDTNLDGHLGDIELGA